MINPAIRVIENNVKQIAIDRERAVKAFETASRVEGYRLMKLLKADLMSGKIAGSTTAPLGEIAKAMGKPKNRAPYRKLARLVGYKARRTGSKYSVWVGWLGMRQRGDFRLSKSYERILTRMQEGAQYDIPDDLRRTLAQYGATRRRRNDPKAKYFFLRKTTTRFRLPPRPAIDRFRAAHLEESRRQVVRNFERKMKGERI